MATFEANAKIIAKMSNGEEKEITTLLTCDGDYREWWENPIGEPWCSKIQYSEQDEDLETARIKYPDEYEPYIDGVTADKVLKILDEPEWEVVEGSWEDD